MEVYMFEMIINISIIIANIAVFVGVIIAIIKLFQMEKSIKLQEKSIVNDHDRRKKQATLEYHTEMYNIAFPKLRMLREKFGAEKISVESISKDKELEEDVILLLNTYEHICVGINTGIFDINLYKLLFGMGTIKCYEQLEDFIDSLRRDRCPTVFADFKVTVSALKKMYAPEENCPYRQSANIYDKDNIIN
jgi:hypothetical protein